MAYKEYLGEYSVLQRDPVAIPQFVRDTILIVTSGLVAFNIITLNAEQMAWVLMFAGFLSAGVTLWSRTKVWPDERVQNEFIDAEKVLEANDDPVVHEVIGDYGRVPVVESE